MSLKQRYSGLSDEGKTVFWLIIADVLVLVGLLPFFFFSNMGLPLGWLLGAVIVLLCYISMVKGSSFILSVAVTENGRNKGRAWAVVFAFLRFALMIGALIVSAVFTFKVEGGYINFFTCAAAYLPLILVAVIFTLAHKKNKEDTKVAKVELEEGEEALDD